MLKCGDDDCEKHGAMCCLECENIETCEDVCACIEEENYTKDNALFKCVDCYES